MFVLKRWHHGICLRLKTMGHPWISQRIYYLEHIKWHSDQTFSSDFTERSPHMINMQLWEHWNNSLINMSASDQQFIVCTLLLLTTRHWTKIQIVIAVWQMDTILLFFFKLCAHKLFWHFSACQEQSYLTINAESGPHYKYILTQYMITFVLTVPI